LASKITYEDDGRNKAITGKIISKNDSFVIIQQNNIKYHIATDRIVCIREESG